LAISRALATPIDKNKIIQEIKMKLRN